MTIVLHHYETSPFSEVLRLALGHKNAGYWSVIIPNIAPKPLLTPLTGGYRKTPVLQIDADVYCDTWIAAQAIEALPGPTLYPEPLGRAGDFIAAMAGGPMFFAAVGAAMAPVADRIPDAFWADRAALFGLSRDLVKLRAPHSRAQFTAGMARLDDSLAARDFVGGEAPGYADFALYMLAWFQRRFNPVAPILDPYANVIAWEARVKAIGHGNPHTTDGQEALALAHDATPDLSEAVDAASGFSAGQAVTVATEDPGADKVAGTLLRLSDREIVIRRDDPDTGTVAVHFPRLGQVLRAA
ncbi:MAG: glutathione S-transferase family protein [Janthinobacterium lividum]